MSRNIIEVRYHYENKKMSEIIKDLVSIDLIKGEKNFKEVCRKIHIFSKVLKCNECGGGMCYRDKYMGYKCTNSHKTGGICTSHSVKEEFLVEQIKKALDAYSKEKQNIENEGILQNKKLITAEGYRKELIKIESELLKIESQLEMMLLDDFNISFSECDIEIYMRALQKKQQFLIMKRGNVKSLIKRNEEEGEIYFKVFKDKLDKVLNLSNLDANIIGILIEKIIVSENKDLKEKRVDVYFKFKEK